MFFSLCLCSTGITIVCFLRAFFSHSGSYAIMPSKPSAELSLHLLGGYVFKPD